MSYVTGEWSPNHLNLKQQKAKKKFGEEIYIRWILQVKWHELSCKGRLIQLDLLPLTYYRAVMKDLVFLYEAFHGYIDINNNSKQLFTEVEVASGGYLTSQWIAIFARFDWLPKLGISLAFHCFATEAKMESRFEKF